MRKRIDLRMDDDVYKLLELEAERRRCSLNWFIADICRSHVDAGLAARALDRRLAARRQMEAAGATYVPPSPAQLAEELAAGRAPTVDEAFADLMAKQS